MSDEDQLFCDPLARRGLTSGIRSHLEFVMERIAALPTRRKLICFGVWVALGLCALALVGLRMWRGCKGPFARLMLRTS
jgi:hypothetical protein